MIIALGLLFASVSNIELQRAFACLNIDVKFSSSSTIKNYLMRRCEKIQSELLSALSNDDIKISLTLNCWFSFNRQEYLAVNAYFIDDNWNYHEVLLTFEHISESHTESRLAKIMQDIISRHKLQDRILATTSDNADNNNTMHEKLLRMLRTRTFDNVHFNVRDIERVSCLAHVIQLTLRKLLGKIRINSRNEDFQTSWNDKDNRAEMKREEKEVSYILVKVSYLINYFFLAYIMFYDSLYDNFFLFFTKLI